MLRPTNMMICIVLLVTIASWHLAANEVNLSGTITNKDSKAVAGAKVALAGTSLSGISDSQGKYQITGTITPIIQNNLSDHSTRLSITRSQLTIQTAQDNTNITIGLYSLKGRNIFRYSALFAAAGNHTCKINSQLSNGSADGLYVLFLRINGSLFTQRVLMRNQMVGSSFFSLHIPDYPQTEVNPKRGYLFDTLVITHASYKTARVSISFLQGTKDITLEAKVWSMKRLPDTGQKGDFTQTFGEDADYTINPPFFIVNNNQTVIDTVTGLIWQKGEGGDMTYESACAYCDSLTQGGSTEWRLPGSHELFRIVNHGKSKPCLDTLVFNNSKSEYWWSIIKSVTDSTKIWVVNAGGGTGAHLKSESINAGGTRHISVRCVRDAAKNEGAVRADFSDNGDSTVTDNITGLMWQQGESGVKTWEDALKYAEGLNLAGHDDWRLPNIKELRSISDDNLSNPSLNKTFFAGVKLGNYWSSTTLTNQPLKAWWVDFRSGLVSYDEKTIATINVRCVRGGVGK